MESGRRTTSAAVSTATLSVSLAVRPARLAILVPCVKSPNWLVTFEAALAAQAHYWGGQANVVLPVDDSYLENPLFWALLDLQDPDAFVCAAMSIADMRFADPRWYES